MKNSTISYTIIITISYTIVYISYTISYTMLYTISQFGNYISSDKWRLPGPAPVIAAGNSDDDQDRDWNSDDRRDFEDQQSAPKSPTAHYPGSRNPLARFLSDVPDWSVFDKAALDKGASRIASSHGRP
jgi:hypothetical protein